MTEPVTDAQAIEAIESLDDYARMMVGVDPSGPRELLYRYLEQAKLARADAERTARNRDMWKSQCERQAEQLASIRRVRDYELQRTRAQVDNAVWLLTGIHSLLYPAPITTPDGRTLVFRPSNPAPHEVLQELSDRIRALPDELAATATASTPSARNCATASRTPATATAHSTTESHPGEESLK